VLEAWQINPKVHIMHKEPENPINQSIIPHWFWILFIIILATWLLGPRIVHILGGSEPPKNAGEFGDQFGVINALFSGLAFLGVLVSIFIQGKEFRSQLREMAKNALEMEKQSCTYQEQLKVFQLQNDLLSRQLVNTQVEERLAAQPFIVLKCNSQGRLLFLTAQNYGSIAYGIELKISNALFSKTLKSAVLIPGGEVGINDALDSEIPSTDTCIILDCSYTTRSGHPVKETFTLPKNLDRLTLHSDMNVIGKEIRAGVEI
jgi:hypothetical protein